MYWLEFCCFKQKTAYEMRISDWSSDVCSSDLIILRQQLAGNIEGHTVRPVTGISVGKALGHLTDRPVPAYAPPPDCRIEEASSEHSRFALMRSLGARSAAAGGMFSASFTAVCAAGGGVGSDAAPIAQHCV